MGVEKTAAVYARVSTGKQAEAGNLERQRLRLIESAALQRAIPVEIEEAEVKRGRRDGRMTQRLSTGPAAGTSCAWRHTGGRRRRGRSPRWCLAASACVGAAMIA